MNFSAKLRWMRGVLDVCGNFLVKIIRNRGIGISPRGYFQNCLLSVLGLERSVPYAKSCKQERRVIVRYPRSSEVITLPAATADGTRNAIRDYRSISLSRDNSLLGKRLGRKVDSRIALHAARLFEDNMATEWRSWNFPFRCSAVLTARRSFLATFVDARTRTRRAFAIFRRSSRVGIVTHPNSESTATESPDRRIEYFTGSHDVSIVIRSIFARINGGCRECRTTRFLQGIVRAWVCNSPRFRECDVCERRRRLRGGGGPGRHRATAEQPWGEQYIILLFLRNR